MSFPKELCNLKFAEYRESITILYLVDDRFKKICDEYSFVKEEVKKIIKRIKNDSQEMLKNLDLSREPEKKILLSLIKTIV